MLSKCNSCFILCIYPLLRLDIHAWMVLLRHTFPHYPHSSLGRRHDYDQANYEIPDISKAGKWDCWRWRNGNDNYSLRGMSECIVRNVAHARERQRERERGTTIHLAARHHLPTLPNTSDCRIGGSSGAYMDAQSKSLLDTWYTDLMTQRRAEYYLTLLRHHYFSLLFIHVSLPVTNSTTTFEYYAKSFVHII